MREFRIKNGIEEQKCKTCGKWKEASTKYYYRKPKLPRGITPNCIICLREYNRIQNKKKPRKKDIKERQKNRKKLVSKNLKCWCSKCKEIHYKNLDYLWVGKLPARFICDKCKSKEIEIENDQNRSVVYS